MKKATRRALIARINRASVLHFSRVIPSMIRTHFKLTRFEENGKSKRIEIMGICYRAYINNVPAREHNYDFTLHKGKFRGYVSDDPNVIEFYQL